MHCAVVQITIPKGIHLVSMHSIYMSVAVHEHAADVQGARKGDFLQHFEGESVKFSNVNAQNLR